MATGLIALAAVSLDDVAAQTVKATGKASGVWLATSAQQAVLATIIGSVAVAAMGTVIAPMWKKIRSRKHV